MLPQAATVALLTLATFISGSLPFSVWLGRLLLHRDVREYGDGNPGATNVHRAGGPAPFLAVLLLDVAKAAVPVAICYHVLDIHGWGMLPIALAPLCGHAFSPFLRFRGGKALAVTLGVWIGLTVWPVPLAALAGVVLWRAILAPTGWAVMLAVVGMLGTILAAVLEPLFIAAIVGNGLLLAWTHRRDLQQRPHIKPAVMRLLRPGGS
jgi:glycerol-3-phosphate acyltransferase PlsY